MREIKRVVIEGHEELRYFDGKSYYRVPKEDLVAAVVAQSSVAVSNADIRSEVSRRWRLAMSSSHIRYHLKALLDAGAIEQIGRGLYRAKPQGIFA